MSDIEMNVKEYIIIEDWNIINGNIIKLKGKVQNHPEFKKDTEIKTSNIVFINDKDKYIQTETGNKYKLGKPSDEFMNESIYNILKELYDSEGSK